MDLLPVEILAIIVDDLAHQDDPITRAALKGLRLSCKRLADIAAPYLFKTLPLWLGSTSLSNLYEASAHPTISGLITGIVFSPISLSQPYVSNDERLHEEISFRFMSGQDSEELLEARHKQYCHGWSCFREEFDILFCQPGEKSALHRLSRALEALPNLESVEIDCDAYYIGAAEIKGKLGRTFGAEFTRTGALTVPVLFNALIASQKALHRFTLNAEQSDLEHREGLRQEVLPLRREELDYNLRDSNLDRFGLHSALHQNRPNISNGPLFSQLKVFELPNVDLHCDITSSTLAMAASVSTILEACQKTLQKLYLGRIWSRSRFGHRFDVDQAIDWHITLSNLQSLTIQCCVMELDRLESVIVACAPLLKDVLLDQVFNNGSWKTFLEQCREQDFPELQSFRIIPVQTGPKASRAFDVTGYLKKLDHVIPPIERDTLHAVDEVT